MIKYYNSTSFFFLDMYTLGYITLALAVLMSQSTKAHLSTIAKCLRCRL